MGVLADIYIAHDEDAVAYDSNPNLWTLDRMESKSILPLELSMLWAIVRGVEWDISLMKEFPCVFQQDGGERLIHRLPAPMFADLLKMAPEQVQTVASRWAATEEMGWPVDNASRFIEDLIRLGRRASESGKSVYLWNCV